MRSCGLLQYVAKTINLDNLCASTNMKVVEMATDAPTSASALEVSSRTADPLRE